MSHPCGHCATPWPSYGNKAWCNPMSHLCGHCTTPWYSYGNRHDGNRGWCNPMSHPCGYCATLWPSNGNKAWCNPVNHACGNSFNSLNEKENENKKTKQWKLKRSPLWEGPNNSRYLHKRYLQYVFALIQWVIDLVSLLSPIMVEIDKIFYLISLIFRRGSLFHIERNRCWNQWKLLLLFMSTLA